MSRILSAIRATPWAITEDGMQVVLDVAGRTNLDPEIIERERGDVLRNEFETRIRDGVAVIPIRGPLLRYANIFTRISGATSYELLAREVGAALADAQVRAIVFDVDSPGGQVNGVQELGELIHDARREKPTAAFISGMGASGGYWLASAAGRVFASPTAMIGSVGAVLEVAVQKGRDDEEVFQFVSSVSPRKRLEPGTAEFAEDAQAIVDDLGRVFVETVARNRGTTVDDVVAHYGQGSVMVGQRALDAGLIDGLATLEQVIADLSALPRPLMGRRPGAGVISTPKARSIPMPNTEAGAAPEGHVTLAELEAAYPAQVAQARTEEREQATVDATLAERKRVQDIMALGAPADMQTEAIESGASVGDLAIKLAEARKARESAVKAEALKARVQTEEGVNAPTPSAGAEDHSDDRARAKRIVAIHNTLRGRTPAAA